MHPARVKIPEKRSFGTGQRSSLLIGLQNTRAVSQSLIPTTFAYEPCGSCDIITWYMFKVYIPNPFSDSGWASGYLHL